MQFTIGTRTFEEPNEALAGRYCIAFIPSVIMNDIKRFHVPGTNGNLTIDSGRRGQILYCVVEYVNTLSQVYSVINDDLELWANTNVTIIDPSATSFTRCKIQDCQVSRPRPVGNSMVKLEVAYTFYRDS